LRERHWEKGVPRLTEKWIKKGPEKGDAPCNNQVRAVSVGENEQRQGGKKKFFCMWDFPVQPGSGGGISRGPSNGLLRKEADEGREKRRKEIRKAGRTMELRCEVAEKRQRSRKGAEKAIMGSQGRPEVCGNTKKTLLASGPETREELR